MVYAEGWQARTINPLKRRIVKKLKDVDVKVVQAMFPDMRTQFRKIADKEHQRTLIAI